MTAARKSRIGVALCRRGPILAGQFHGFWVARPAQLQKGNSSRPGRFPAGISTQGHLTGNKKRCSTCPPPRPRPSTTPSSSAPSSSSRPLARTAFDRRIADQAGSRRRTSRLFKRWAGLTPKAFLQALTIDRARELLRDSAWVLDAAYEVGLSGPGRLHDLFVTHEAMTPGDYSAGRPDPDLRLPCLALRRGDRRRDAARPGGSRLRRRRGSRGGAGRHGPPLAERRLVATTRHRDLRAARLRPLIVAADAPLRRRA